MRYVFVLLCVLFLPACQIQYEKICFNETCFQAELAVTPEERAKGLMYRETMDEDKGMLFVFDASGEYSFWMKNTLIPLDILWIDENKTIVYMNENTPPCEQDLCQSYKPDKNANYVLELNAGTVDKFGIEIGDKVFIS